ncbi:hypothetical protein LT679_03635 [Mucilaginibacter roseus]|uniref:Uncharacterized protein n=1 Tax=Mucilaginibacter roseus TaxID=1528868 RepID=A0ABS8U0T3_9SPHI|nr:hypothetical protein [Mucilaginibacter roseus]MCD8739685.1 hypothetical protein [Mucilaginibacter roseus]
MTSLKFGNSNKQFGGFKFSYNRGLPTYLAPKLLTSKKQEEYFIANIYAQHMIFNDEPVSGVQVSEDDSHKGADVIMTVGKNKVGIQITRFTLTSYLQRKDVAIKRAIKIATEVQQYGAVPIPVNVSIYTPDTMVIPTNSKKDDKALSQEIARMIKENLADLSKRTQQFFNLEVKDERVKKLTPLITLQAIPEGFNSNYGGKGNVFVNYDFDNIGFSENDIIDEAENIFQRKNGGKSEILLIWVDEAETVGQKDLFVKALRNAFGATTFKRVLLFNFYNEKHLHFIKPIETSLIFDKDQKIND